MSKTIVPSSMKKMVGGFFNGRAEKLSNLIPLRGRNGAERSVPFQFESTNGKASVSVCPPSFRRSVPVEAEKTKTEADSCSAILKVCTTTQHYANDGNRSEALICRTKASFALCVCVKNVQCSAL